MKRLLSFCLIIIGLTGLSFAQNQGNIKQIYTFPKEQLGWSSVNSKDDSLLVTVLTDQKCWIYWFKDGKTLKKINNVQGGVSSPDCKYYYYQDNGCNIKDKKDSLINKFKGEEEIESYQWSWDSKYIYISEFGLDTEIEAWKTNKIYRCDISNGNKELIFSQKFCFHPVVVNNPDVLYIMKNNGGDNNYDIFKYHIKTKQLEKIKLPLDNPQLYDEFTVSPDERIIVFADFSTRTLYFVDLKSQKILNKKSLSFTSSPFKFYWKADSSYLLFTITSKEVYKYTVP